MVIFPAVYSPKWTIHQITPTLPKSRFFPRTLLSHFFQKKKKPKISNISQKYDYYQPKKSKKYSIKRRDLRKSGSNNDLLSSTLATFKTDKKCVFERCLLFFGKNSKKYSIIRHYLWKKSSLGVGCGVIS